MGERDRTQSVLYMMHLYGSLATEIKGSPYELKFQDFTKRNSLRSLHIFAVNFISSFSDQGILCTLELVSEKKSDVIFIIVPLEVRYSIFFLSFVQDIFFTLIFYGLKLTCQVVVLGVSIMLGVL